LKLLDLNILHNTCNASKAAVTKGYRAITKDGRSCWYKDNGKSVLAVAHIDHVCQEKHFAHVKLGKELLVYSPRLDDRLGVYTIQHVLPQIGCECDILLCDDEESGRSTASLFETDKKYSWMVEFDRSGDDVVVYDYDDKDWKDALKAEGFKIGFGSYSDISRLDGLGICGVNIGVGYQDYHGPRSYFVVSDWLSNLAKFQTFFDKHEHHTFPYTKVGRWTGSRSLDDGYWDEPRKPKSLLYDDLLCPYCENPTLTDSAVYEGYFHCKTCGELIHQDDACPNHKLYEDTIPF